jgi:hypothetical protein
MSILRTAALVAIIIFCGAFVPVGGCAKGCGQAGKMAAREGDDIARLGTRTRFGVGAAAPAGVADDLARTGRYGAYSDDLARGTTHADDLAHAADDINTSSFASELEQSSIKLSEKQNDELLDALKDVGEEVIGQLAEGDDAEDEADIKRAATELDKRLEATLTKAQLRKFHAQFGTSKQVVERLVREQATGSGR